MVASMTMILASSNSSTMSKQRNNMSRLLISCSRFFENEAPKMRGGKGGAEEGLTFERMGHLLLQIRHAFARGL
jgi:hypothetical protein